jgi:peptide deformylase
MKLITDKKKLQVPVVGRKLTKLEVKQVTETLETELKKHKGYGLSTNQIGMDAIRACIINVVEPLVLINPKIIDRTEEKVIYVESCLSLPKTLKKAVHTVRHKGIKVECDNLGVVEFGPDTEKPWEDANDFWEDKGMLECVCAQHELDHLNGKLITDKDVRFDRTVRSTKKYGRNERVMVKLPDGKTEFMKYKKALPFLEYGAEIL